MSFLLPKPSAKLFLGAVVSRKVAKLKSQNKTPDATEWEVFNDCVNFACETSRKFIEHYGKRKR